MTQLAINTFEPSFLLLKKLNSNSIASYKTKKGNTIVPFFTKNIIYHIYSSSYLFCTKLSTRWHATKCPSEISTNFGSPWLHSGLT